MTDEDILDELKSDRLELEVYRLQEELAELKQQMKTSLTDLAAELNNAHERTIEALCEKYDQQNRDILNDKDAEIQMLTNKIDQLEAYGPGDTDDPYAEYTRAEIIHAYESYEKATRDFANLLFDVLQKPERLKSQEFRLDCEEATRQWIITDREDRLVKGNI